MTRDALRSAADAEVARWEGVLADELTRLFDRQEHVVLARLQGTKARKHTRHWDPPADRPLEVKGIIDPSRWAGEAAKAVVPIVGRLFAAIYRKVSVSLDADTDATLDPDDETVAAAIADRVDRIVQGVTTAVEEVETYVAAEETAGTAMPDMAAGVKDLYAARRPTWADRIATMATTGSINQAALFAAADRGSSAKQWLSCRDSRVRATHAKADGQVRLLDERFRLGGFDGHGRSLLLFPCDPGPSVPLDEVINCRCTLLFSPPRKRTATSSPAPALAGKALVRTSADFKPCGRCGSPKVTHLAGTDQPRCAACGFHVALRPGVETKARVRTAAGAAQYGQPIGSVIVPDVTGGSSSSASSSSSSRAGKPAIVGHIAGTRVIDASDDDDVRTLIASHSASGVAPDPAETRVVALRDRKGRTGAYVMWQTRDGAQPAGTVLAVSVHPALKGQRIGDQLVALAAGLDPKVKVTTRPRTSRTGGGSTTPAAASAPAPRRTPATPAATRGPAGPPVVRDRTRPGDAPGTSGDFDADAARIGRLQKAYLADGADTTSLHSRGGRYTAARTAQHKAIIDHFLNAPGVKANRELVVLGGLPGAGKTTTINSPAGQQALGIDLSEYVTVNADEVKAEMVARGMVPDYPGLSPDEAATLYHAESFEVAHSLMRQAARRGLNFVYDTSLKSPGQAGFATSAASSSTPPPWKSTMVFVDVPIAVAKQRARDRYLAGGRYMPLALIDTMKAYGGGRSSGPAQNFDTVKRGHRWAAFDNAGAAPVLAGKGSRK